MEWKFSFSSELNPIILYAAIVATASLLWQIITHLRTGPRLTARVDANRILAGPGYPSDNRTYLIFSAANTGTADTTITNVALSAYDGRWARLRGRPAQAAIVPGDPPFNSTPYVLKVGQTFMTACTQSPELEAWSRDYLLFAEFIHSSSARPIRKRIGPIERKPS
jgi:hypothetical protein